MNNITEEFTVFIKALLLEYPKPGKLNLSLLGKQSRDFNHKVQLKIDELIAKNPEFLALDIKIALAPIRAKYRISPL